MADYQILTVEAHQEFDKEIVCAFKVLWKHYKKGDFDKTKAKRVFIPIIKRTVAYHNKALENYYEGERVPASLLPTKKDQEEAVDDLIQEFLVEQVKFRNYWKE